MSSSVTPGLSFWSHNVQKSSVSYTALLAEYGDNGPDIVCIQEPPWIQVGLQRSLESPEGDKIFGLPTLRGYSTYFPTAASWSTSSPTERPRAILLVHKRWPSTAILYRQDLSFTRDICTIVMSVQWTDNTQCNLFISSCYNGAPDETSTLDTKLSTLDVPLNAHWILGGDFNRHHPDWSDRRAPSVRPHQAAALRSFIGQRGLTPLNNPEVATRRTPDGSLSTVLDLALCSPTLSDLGMEGTFFFFNLFILRVIHRLQVNCAPHNHTLQGLPAQVAL